MSENTFFDNTMGNGAKLFIQTSILPTIYKCTIKNNQESTFNQSIFLISIPIPKNCRKLPTLLPRPQNKILFRGCNRAHKLWCLHRCLFKSYIPSNLSQQ